VSRWLSKSDSMLQLLFYLSKTPDPLLAIPAIRGETLTWPKKRPDQKTAAFLQNRENKSLTANND
jgi:hypothetical protein